MDPWTAIFFSNPLYRLHPAGQGTTKSKAQKPFPKQHTLMATSSTIDRHKQHPHAVGKAEQAAQVCTTSNWLSVDLEAQSSRVNIELAVS